MKFRIYTSFELFKAIRSVLNFKGTHIYFFPSYAMGGAEKVHLEIVKLNKTNPLVIFTSSSKNDFHKNDFFDHSCCIEISEILKFTFLKRILYFFLKIKINKCKVVFGCNSKYFYEIVAIIDSKSVKIIDLFHAFHKKRNKGILFWSKSVQSKIHQRVVINSKVKIKLKEYYSNNNITNYPKITVIDNYVEMPNKTRRVNGKIKIVYLGRFCTKTKKTQFVLEIANNLCENQNFEFHLAGFNQSETEGFNISNNCIIHGLLNEKEVGELLLQSDLLIITSKNEGFPMVIMEAMMCGVVPITTNVGGISCHVDDSNGYLINYNSEIIQTFTSILKNISRTKIEPKSKNAKTYAIKHFTKQSFISSYQKVLYK